MFTYKSYYDKQINYDHYHKLYSEYRGSKMEYFLLRVYTLQHFILLH